MNKIPIAVDYPDRDYSVALSKALGKRSEFILYDISDAPPDSLILNTASAALYTPVSQIIAKIMAQYNRQERPAKALSDVKFTAFTAIIGGCGLSSCAYTYACLKSRIFNSKISLISFDPCYRKLNIADNDYAVQSVDEINDAADFDELVIDTPYGYGSYFDVLDQSNQRVVVMGFDEKRVKSSEAFYDDLVQLADSYINPPKTLRIYNSYDPYFDVNDMHGQLGGELLKFINEN